MKRKQILITASFRKRLKKLRHQFSEDDVVDNIKEFIRLGLRKGESLLTSEPFGHVIIKKGVRSPFDLSFGSRRRTRGQANNA